MAVINFPIIYINDPDTGKPLFNGQIYVGVPDLDPEVEVNQKQLNVVQEDDAIVPVPQPFTLSTGGRPVYNGNTVRLDVDGNYSIKILDKNGAQKYYIENVYEGKPVTELDIINDISQAYEFATVADMEAFATTFPDGKPLHVTSIDAQYIATSGVSPDIANPPLVGGLYAELKNGDNPYKYRAVGDGVTDDTESWNLWEAATVNIKTVLIGSYLVSGVVKEYKTPTFANTIDNNYAAGLYALESNVNGENNTAFGKSSLQKTEGVLPLGSNNAAFGFEALGKNTEGYRNAAFGYQALHEQEGNLVMGNSNSAFGYQSLYNNTTGKDNQSFGYLSMFFNVAGGGNVANGYRALYNNIGTDSGDPAYAAIDGSFNVAVGYECMLENTYGKSNTAVGWRALQNNLTAFRNSSYGQESMRDNTTGNNNCSFGYHSMLSCVNGSDNTVIGYEALFTSTGAMRNVVAGREAMKVSTTATDCVSLGYQSMVANIGGIDNVAVGYRALSRNTSGSNITAVGHQALEFTTGGGSNLAFSNCSGLGSDTRVSADNQVQLGDSATTTYAYGAVQDRSDERDKLDPKDLTDAHIAFFMEVEWKQYRMNYREAYNEAEEYTDGETETIKVPVYDGELISHYVDEEREIVKTRIIKHENDGSKAGSRYHIGAIAQQVELAMKKHNIDFAGLQHHAYGGGEDIYSIGYQEFIGIQGLIIQRQQVKLISIEDRLTRAGL